MHAQISGSLEGSLMIIAISVQYPSVNLSIDMNKVMNSFFRYAESLSTSTLNVPTSLKSALSHHYV